MTADLIDRPVHETRAQRRVGTVFGANCSAILSVILSVIISDEIFGAIFSAICSAILEAIGVILQDVRNVDSSRLLVDVQDQEQVLELNQQDREQVQSCHCLQLTRVLAPPEEVHRNEQVEPGEDVLLDV